MKPSSKDAVAGKIHGVNVVGRVQRKIGQVKKVLGQFHRVDYAPVMVRPRLAPGRSLPTAAELEEILAR